MTSAQVGDTGLVLRVPEVDPVIGQWRARYDSVAPLGVPAHVTVLYPWIPAGLLTDGDLAAIMAIAAATDPIRLTFAAVGRFPDILWLDPQPGGPILALIAAVTDRWPDYLPYGGRYGARPVPHLTVADSAGPAELEPVVADIERSLPVQARIAELSLVVRRADGWDLDRSFPFRTSAQHDPAQHDPAQHDPAQHDPAQHDPAQHDPAQHDPARLGSAQREVAGVASPADQDRG